MITRALMAATLPVLAITLGAAPAGAVGAWRWPVPSPVVVLRPFDQPAGPYGPGHRGVDLAAREGAPIRAGAAGTVLVAGTVAGHPVVVVGHGAARTIDELRTTYEPVVAAVAVGAQVSAGAVLGTLGAWPDHCARSCLHWGLRRGDAYLDPTLLVRGPVRLLPAGAPQPAVGSAPALTPRTTRTRDAGITGEPEPPEGRRGSGLVVVGGAGAALGAVVLARRVRPRRSGP